MQPPSRKKGFWQRCRKGHSEDSPLFSRSDTIESDINDTRVATLKLSPEPAPKPKRYRIHRFVEWIKTFSKGKEAPHFGHDYREILSQTSSPLEISSARAKPCLGQNSCNINTFNGPDLTLDGTNDQLPSHVVTFQPPRQAQLLRHRSFLYSRRKQDGGSPSTLKHRKSTPGLIRRKLSRHLQGTVVRHTNVKPQSMLAPIPLNFFQVPSRGSSSSRPSVIPVFGIENQHDSTIQQTLRTVEVTAATKIYLESHFSQLLSFPTSRSLRRRKFENELEKKVVNEQERRLLWENWRRQETAYLRTLRGRALNIGNYEIVKVIGKGAFGVVKLVREKYTKEDTSTNCSSCDIEWWNSSIVNEATSIMSDEDDGKDCNDSPGFESAIRHSCSRRSSSKVYALKVMQKADMLTRGQEGHLRAERDLLVASQGSKWIVPLIAAFQDKDNLYLVMEYLIGGDFLALLIKKTVLNEDETRFYVAEMICCIEEAHALGYIHRDIKPDNFVFTAQGHLKLCDFGLAFSGRRTHDGEYINQQRHNLLDKVGLSVEGDTIDRKEGKRVLQRLNENIPDQISRTYRNEEEECPSNWLRINRDLARSIVGTNQYMAPEIVRVDTYDGRCDWWSLGVIIYECLYGFTPFYSRNWVETREKVLNWRTTLTFPSEPPISPQAYHLIASLLCERQHRLTSRTYAANDLYWEDIPISLQSTYEHRNFANRWDDMHENRTADQHERRSSTASYVVPHDGMEIKSHPFFRGVNWQKLHMLKPPFTPEGLRGGDDTKYFDEESYDSSNKSFSDSKDTSSIGASTEVLSGQPVYPKEENQNHAQERGDEIKVKKRARDKLLRDPIHGTELLELRKEVAFWGYSYRRPKTLDGAGHKVTGRRRVTLAGCASVTPRERFKNQVSRQVGRDRKTAPGTGEYSGTTIDAEELEIE